MNIGRIVFYVFLAYVAYMLIGHVVQVTWQEKVKREEKTQAPVEAPQPDPNAQEIELHMREGLLAFRKGNMEEAEKRFLAGREFAKEQGYRDYFNHFTIMLGNLYLDSNNLDSAESLLKEAATQEGIDKISYNNQLVVLYEKQGKHDEMCKALFTLKEALSSLQCDAYADDIAILEAQQDDQKIMEIFKKPNIEAIVDCAGRRMVDNKIADKKCSKE